ncbi:hypothetical protein [Streptomyces sp. NPDC050504]|uniref:hypothetical protein n=1 Tax=Streptomyces sp. NPDC050504 TaxID=3365618 RepID=UPI0037A1AC8F
MRTAKKKRLVHTASAALLAAAALAFTAGPASAMGWIPDYPNVENAAPATVEWPDFLRGAPANTPAAAAPLDAVFCC